jgi:hypothetical protein
MNAAPTASVRAGSTSLPRCWTWEDGTPFEQEKDPLVNRETLELVRAYYKIREGRVRKRIFEMVKAVGATRHAEVLGGRKGSKPRHA